VLAQCAPLAHLNLCWNQIGAAGAESLAGVLAQYTTLAELDFRFNDIGAVGEGRLRASWRDQKPLALICRHPALLALCHLFSRQVTRKSDILYTYIVVAFGLALSL
jgi:hypothetical protein